MQTIHNLDEKIPCKNCGQDLTEIGNFVYTGVTVDSPRKKNEECACRKCGEHFIIQYRYFDEKNHIKAFVFNGDINDPTYNWQDQLTSEQKKEISDHLLICDICKERLDEETLTDAWIASLLHSQNKK